MRPVFDGGLKVLGIRISKKFVAMLIGIVAPFLATKLGLPEELLQDYMEQTLILISIYLGGQSVADALERKGAEAAQIEAEAAAPIIAGEAAPEFADDDHDIPHSIPVNPVESPPHAD